MRLIALFRLAFAPAPSFSDLTLPHARNSSAHSSKGTPSRYRPCDRQHALTACGHVVSGAISLPSRGTFHLSLTVLVRYRSPGSIQPYQVVLADSRQITGVRRYSGHVTGDLKAFAYRTITVYGALSHTLRLTCNICNCAAGCQPDPRHPTTPHAQPLTGITHAEFRLNPLSLATTHGITIVFSSCGY